MLWQPSTPSCESKKRLGGDVLREDAEGHFRDEYSPYGWVMDGLVWRSGWAINHKHIEAGVIGT